MSLNVMTVTLDLDRHKFLGISIVGQNNESGDGGIYIGSIMKGGAVAADGRIEAGDMLLQVNDVNFEDMSNNEAVEFLRKVIFDPIVFRPKYFSIQHFLDKYFSTQLFFEPVICRAYYFWTELSFEPLICRPNYFSTQIFFDPIIFRPNYFLTQLFFEPIIFRPNYFWTQ